jgi:hypothetical protein
MCNQADKITIWAIRPWVNVWTRHGLPEQVLNASMSQPGTALVDIMLWIRIGRRLMAPPFSVDTTSLVGDIRDRF